MHPIIRKTFGGLSTAYYFRNFIFGLIFVAIMVSFGMRTLSGVPISLVIVLAVNAILYPYSRFVYESIIDFIVGENVFVVSAVAMLFVKFVTMALCFFCAIFIAPIGLAYLYYHHTKQERQEQQD